MYCLATLSPPNLLFGVCKTSILTSNEALELNSLAHKFAAACALASIKARFVPSQLFGSLIVNVNVGDGVVIGVGVGDGGGGGGLSGLRGHGGESGEQRRCLLALREKKRVDGLLPEIRRYPEAWGSGGCSTVRVGEEVVVLVVVVVMVVVTISIWGIWRALGELWWTGMARPGT